MTSGPTTGIIPAPPRDDVRITLPAGQVLQGAPGHTIEHFIQAALNQSLIDADWPVMAAVFEGQLRELSYPLQRDGQLQPVTLQESDGGRIYRRTLVLLMVTAAGELWPGTKINVKYAVPDGGFYCEAANRPPFSVAELQQLEAHMRQLVAEDHPIHKRMVPLEEGVQLFKARGDEDKVRLLAYRTRDDLTLYDLRGHADYYYGYMLPATGYLTLFRLIPEQRGFILQYPRREHGQHLPAITSYNKLSAVFAQTDEWLERLDVEDMGRLNHRLRDGHAQETILIAEALHERWVAHIASEIRRAQQARGVRVVLIAGPSSSGKTTFAKRLSIQLLAHGLRPFTLEIDNFFVDRPYTPLDENGAYDFESLQAIDLPRFNAALSGLMAGEAVELPRFDFYQGLSVPDKTVQISEREIIISEGIHGLNPGLVPDIPDESVYRVYVSALTALNIDQHNRVPTTDVRLLRRIVRDARTRGYSATDTLQRWGSVRRGEKRNIFPYQENADILFNSALVYELAALRPLAEPLLLQVEHGTPTHIEAHRLLSFLRWVYPLPTEEQGIIPDTSLLREFIGGSILADYHPGTG